jgi:multiple sugar transport system substrate-binding protein
VEADLDKDIIDEWDNAQYQALSLLDGSQFALPKYHGALGLFYNTGMFDQQRVDYPDGSWDHDDYHQAMQLLTRDTDHDGKFDIWGSMMDISWDRIQVHVNGWGGHFVDPSDPYKSLLGEDPSLKALQWIRDRIWTDRVMASFLDVNNLETRHAFIQKKIAMVEDGSWALKDILENAPFRVGASSFPSGPVRKVTLATTDGFAIYAGTKYPEAAWEFIKFLVSREYGQAMIRSHLLQPARLSLVDNWAEEIRKSYPAHGKTLNLQAFAEGHAEGYSVTAEIFPNMEEARRLTRAAWEKIFMLGQEPVDIIKDVSEQIERAQVPAA